MPPPNRLFDAKRIPRRADAPPVGWWVHPTQRPSWPPRFSITTPPLQWQRAVGQFAGNGGRIAGVVYSLAIPAAARRVRLHDRDSGTQVAETVSGPGGEYEFINVNTRRTYFVTAFDVTTGYNAVIQDRVVPTLVAGFGPYVPPPAAPGGPGPGNYTPSYPLNLNLAGAYAAPVNPALNLV